MKTRLNTLSLMARLIVITATGLTLAACGVKSSPTQPDGATYPRQYPAALPALPAYTGKDEERPAGSGAGDRTGQSAGQTAPASSIYQYPNPPSYVPPKQ